MVRRPIRAVALFPTWAFDSGQRKWYAVDLDLPLASIDEYENDDECGLHNILSESVPAAAHVEWEGIRLFPNWLVNDVGAVYIGGVKRLLAFLTTDDVGM